MGLEAIISLIVVGLVAGWLAGQVMKGSGFGLVGNIIVGIVGAFIGTSVQGALDISLGIRVVDSIISALIGACLLLFVVGLVKR